MVTCLPIGDRTIYAATATVQAKQPIEQLVVSDVKALVQQQYFFEMLWSQAILAKQTIKEIKEHAKREFMVQRYLLYAWGARVNLSAS